MAVVTFASGCFWGIEAAFQRVAGVIQTAVGYMGGSFENPTYKEVCTDRTGHAEVVQVTFDPARVSYEDLLEVFRQVHDPTQVERQGSDVGTRYRSAIFFHDADKTLAARESRDPLHASGRLRRPIATEITARRHVLASRRVSPEVSADVLCSARFSLRTGTLATA
ncbi:MAG TPA: peptide-methionine (S)-S-oxide reductase MsrA, partial [Bryobacteraceae bacterium]|nr:peptide-methionine (S)-S-oxide reductase MsrA [Bryobacteraceae bacterium]